MGLKDKAKIIHCLNEMLYLDILAEFALPPEQRKICINVYDDALDKYFSTLIEKEKIRRAEYDSTKRVKFTFDLERKKRELDIINTNYERIKENGLEKIDETKAKIEEIITKKQKEIETIKKELYGNVIGKFISKAIEIEADLDFEYNSGIEVVKFTLDELLSFRNGTKQS